MAGLIYYHEHLSEKNLPFPIASVRLGDHLWIPARAEGIQPLLHDVRYVFPLSHW